MRHQLILISNMSDAQALMLLFNRHAFSDEITPFARKNVYLFYGDGPYTDNKFVSSVYIWVPDSSLAQKMSSYAKAQWSSGKWGWWILSYVFAELINNNNNVIREIEIIDKEDRELDRLKFLCELALPPDKNIIKSGEAGGGDVKVAFNRKYLPYGNKCFKVKIDRVIPSFNVKLINKIFENIQSKTKNKSQKILIVTLGGAEHNVYLNFLTAYMRKKYKEIGKQQILYDARNVFDFDNFQKNRLNKVLLETHGFINVYLQTLDGSVILSREGGQTGGVVVKISNVQTPFHEKNMDLLAIIGCGRYGALATKLTLARLLLDDADKIQCRDGIYYMLYNDEIIKKIIDKDIVAEIDSIIGELREVKIREANYLMPIP